MRYLFLPGKIIFHPEGLILFYPSVKPVGKYSPKNQRYFWKPD